MKKMGKGLGCISSKPHAHVVEFASTTSNSKAKLNINASPLHSSEEIRFAPVPSSSNTKLGINSSLEQGTGKTQTNDGDFEALLARAQAAKINNNLIIRPQWTRDQQLLSQKKTLKQDNPKVFFDIGIGRNDNVGQLVMELYEDTNPVTVHNFRVLCTGELGTNGDALRLHYKSTGFHRIVREFMCQGGDLTRGQGNSPSIWGTKFPDENFVHKHTGPGVLSMANKGPNTNGSQFFLCTAATPWLNDMHVVFGQLLEGFEVLKAMEAVGSKSGTTSEDVKIVDCGQLS